MPGIVYWGVVACWLLGPPPGPPMPLPPSSLLPLLPIPETMPPTLAFCPPAPSPLMLRPPAPPPPPKLFDSTLPTAELPTPTPRTAAPPTGLLLMPAVAPELVPICCSCCGCGGTFFLALPALLADADCFAFLCLCYYQMLPLVLLVLI